MRPRSNVVQDNVVRAASKRLCRRPPPCARLRFLCGSGAAAAIRELLTQPRSERTRKTLAPTPGTWKSQGSENRLRSLRSCNFGVQGQQQPGLIHRHPPPAIQATRRLHMAPCAKRDAQRVPRQLGVSMGARATDPLCAPDPHLFSPASAAAFLRATSRRRVGRSNWW